ncbi:hypothetical protein QBC38DRAFT_448750 [Podospora fimiseda]|uniref:Uncharacterized protein n=1 Tax=Podospora fimiseda TaxID=252190 RepID=A0AAN6YMC0_9PEZI|nr:hypothetical protein QBC38DRAFT_448750 [Podospora fimiseda]
MEISEMNHADALQIAHGLFIYVQDQVSDGFEYFSYFDWEENEGLVQDDRRFSTDNHARFIELIKKRREAGHVWDWGETLSKLDEAAYCFARKGLIDPWYEEACKLLREIIDAEKAKEVAAAEKPKDVEVSASTSSG